MSNPFDDLESDADSSSESDSDDTHREQSSDKPTRETEESAGTEGPPFEYSEVRQRPLYARGETWDNFDDALGITIIPELRKAGIRDEEKREIHDAVLRLASEEPERVAELIEEERKL
ncbi:MULTISPECIES: hypothetical protein [Halobacteriales]|uniref:Uncharacterized protein n=2 Tax=Halobacteriales TaxID=2235 RepID=A0A1I0QYN7_9EURY|nr:hypothetical protein [Natrinema salifodinae]SEW33000.1 hypothetical protein SAMN05216285_4184 [Natrinema salifodinae]